MYDQPNDLESRVRQLDETVEHLTSEITSLKLEVATLISALRDGEFQHARRASRPIPIQPPVRPSMAPAAIVVLVATGLLSWQLISTPRPDRLIANASQAPSITHRVDPIARGPAATEAPSTEPPITPLVHPTIYKGTLTVKANQPGATVFVNRKSVGTAPVRLRNLRAGAHLVWVEHDGYRRWTRVVTVPAEHVTQVSVDLEPVVEPLR